MEFASDHHASAHEIDAPQLLAAPEILSGLANGPMNFAPSQKFLRNILINLSLRMGIGVVIVIIVNFFDGAVMSPKHIFYGLLVIPAVLAVVGLALAPYASRLKFARTVTFDKTGLTITRKYEIDKRLRWDEIASLRTNILGQRYLIDQAGQPINAYGPAIANRRELDAIIRDCIWLYQGRRLKNNPYSDAMHLARTGLEFPLTEAIVKSRRRAPFLYAGLIALATTAIAFILYYRISNAAGLVLMTGLYGTALISFACLAIRAVLITRPTFTIAGGILKIGADHSPSAAPLRMIEAVQWASAQKLATIRNLKTGKSYSIFKNEGAVILFALVMDGAVTGTDAKP